MTLTDYFNPQNLERDWTNECRAFVIGLRAPASAITW
jgi:hypothetical protein